MNTPSTSLGKRRPNILLFLTDDHGPWSLPVYGNSEMGTPVFSRLAREGAVFENAFTPSPVCSPARACVMTGRTPSQVGLHDFLQEFVDEVGARDWLADEETMPALLRASGYHTMLSGKWHMGSRGRAPRGFDRAFGFIGRQGTHNGSYTYHLDGVPLPVEGNKSRIVTDRALEFLDAAPDDRPFFLNIGYIATHSPWLPEHHEPEVLAKTEGMTFADIPDLRPHPWLTDGGEGAFCAPGATRADLLKRARGYYAAVHELDREIGRVLAGLEHRGLLDNTIVVYVSDHGCAIGHNGFAGKGNATRPLNMCDISTRVPLIVRGPGIAAGLRIPYLVDHYDLFRAVMEWSGAAWNDGADRPGGGNPGRSLAPLAAGRDDPGRSDAVYGEYGDLRMIRTATHKLVLRHPAGPHELFDLVRDPGETFNFAGWAEYKTLQAGLSDRLAAWYRSHEDPAKSGLRVKDLPAHGSASEAWRDGRREARGLQVY
ncbi:hypothetical protein DB346_15340 [Verrucomicrobia bacterium LW23]|nr:hypothetical protein DB346_15340 [Verrucomicrobia bacterium LW23]